MSPDELDRLRKLLKASVEGPQVQRMIGHVQCLCCGRSLDTWPQRMWHRLRCWKRHPRQATNRSESEEGGR